MDLGNRLARKATGFPRAFAAAVLVAGLFPQVVAFADDGVGQGAAPLDRARPLEGRGATANPTANGVTLPQGASEDWWRRVQRGLAEGEYHPSDNGRGLQAPNRTHNLRTYFESTGIRLHDRTAAGSPELAGLSLIGMGHGDNLGAVPAGTVNRSAARVEIRRPSIIEWYENSARGLEQGFIPICIDQSPCAHLRWPMDMIFHG